MVKCDNDITIVTSHILEQTSLRTFDTLTTFPDMFCHNDLVKTVRSTTKARVQATFYDRLTEFASSCDEYVT